jgi:hypothetical protein
MASPSTDGNKPASGNRARGIVILVIALFLVAAIVATFFLGNPWYTIARVGFYAFVLVAICLQLRECVRLAKAPEYVSKLQLVGFWLALTALTVIGHIGQMFQSDNKDYVEVATDLGVYLALLTSLELVKMLLSRMPSKDSAQTDFSVQAGAKNA